MSSRTNQVEQVNVYVDEVKETKNALGEKWMYIGVLAVPTMQWRQAYEQLLMDREDVDYQRELHFTKLRNLSTASAHNEKSALAKRWVSRFLNDNEKIFHFNLLGLNLTNLQYDAFGDTPRERRIAIYNRFLRPALSYPLQYFFSDRSVIIKYLFHDISEFRRQPWFRDHIVKSFNHSSIPIMFSSYRIQFVDSDHNKEAHFPRHSHFIQLCDVILGAMTQVLDNRNTKDGCNELARELWPLMKILVEPKKNKKPGGPYNHYQRIYMSFFPSQKLTLKQLEDKSRRSKSTFYVVRDLLWEQE